MDNRTELLLNIAKLNALISRKLFLGGIGFSDFAILHHLAISPGNKLRRTDIAEKIGLTASGVTRLLIPMEKIGLVTREPHPEDARAAFVVLAPGGARTYEEAVSRMDSYVDSVIPPDARANELLETLRDIGGRIAWN